MVAGGSVTMSIIGIDIGGTNFRIGIVDGERNASNLRKIPVKAVFNSGEVLEDLLRYLRKYVEDTDVSPEAIAIGFPATIDRDRNRVLQAPNVPFMENLPVRDFLQEEFKLPVFIERDVTMALYYDIWKSGFSPADENICGMYFGTGIGNALIINGKPLVGAHGCAGEAGHIPVDGSLVWCGCGNYGCIEALAGGKFLTALCRDKFTDTLVEEIFVRRGKEPEINLFIDRMSAVVATQINMLDPDRMIIGGGVPAMKGFPRELFMEKLRFHVRKPLPCNDLRITFTEDVKEKSVVGAAILAGELMDK